MTHEQMAAWLMLEGWEYARETTGTYPFAYRRLTAVEDGALRGEMCICRDAYAEYTARGRARFDERIPTPWSDAPYEVVQLIYQEIVSYENGS